MGSTESAGGGFDSRVIRQTDLSQFWESEASNGIDRSTLQINPGSYDKATDQGTVYFNKQGSEDAFNTFATWAKKSIDTQNKFNEYVKLKYDRPGRQATILTPTDNKTVLGGS